MELRTTAQSSRLVKVTAAEPSLAEVTGMQGVQMEVPMLVAMPMVTVTVPAAARRQQLQQQLARLSRRTFLLEIRKEATSLTEETKEVNKEANKKTSKKTRTSKDVAPDSPISRTTASKAGRM